MTADENRIDRLTCAAGLGAQFEEDEKPIFTACVQRVRKRFQGLGIDIPMFQHPKLGTF
jgi:hypothetical protein